MSVLKSMLTAVEVNKDKSWQSALNDVQIAINSTVNSVMKASPLELLLGKVARPLSLMCTNNEIELDVNEIRSKSIENINKNFEYDKNRFDSHKIQPKKFLIGDFVLIENEERNQVKLDPKFKGPYKVIDILEGDRYMLGALDSNRTYKFAYDKLRALPKDPELMNDVTNDNL